MDVYFQFGCAGDQYLGRILAFRDPSKPTFATLPPHWKDPSHESIKRGLNVAFRNVQSEHERTNHDPSGLLSLLLASMVYHSDWIHQIKSKYPNHPFLSLPLFDEPELLKELKEQVTLEPNDDVPTVTGSPPHVDHAIAIKEVFDMCTSIKDGQDLFQEKLEESVSKAVDKKVSSEGGINASILDQKLGQLRDYLDEKIDTVAINGSGPSASSDLKHKSKKTDLKAWRGIFKLMEKAVTVPESMSSIDNEFVSKSYQDATDYLKANYRAFYIFRIQKNIWQHGKLVLGFARPGQVK